MPGDTTTPRPSSAGPGMPSGPSYREGCFTRQLPVLASPLPGSAHRLGRGRNRPGGDRRRPDHPKLHLGPRPARLGRTLIQRATLVEPSGVGRPH